MRIQKPIKVCLVASAGGHLTQLLKLSDCWQGNDAVYVSTVDAVNKKLREYGRTYIIGECNRQQPFKAAWVLMQCIKVVWKERPDVEISTGAAPAFLLCITAKIFGAKIVWIDSIANVERLSMSGQMAKPFSSLFLTQWPELAKKYNDVEYTGAVT